MDFIKNESDVEKKLGVSKEELAKILETSFDSIVREAHEWFPVAQYIFDLFINFSDLPRRDEPGRDLKEAKALLDQVAKAHVLKAEGAFEDSCNMTRGLRDRCRAFASK